MDIMETIREQIVGNRIILYMKGSPNQPQCGFSARTVQALMSCGEKFAYVDVLSSPEIRANLPTYANWPTFPQLWVDGELSVTLDWEDAAIGDPYCDVAGARVELLYRYGPEAMERFTHAYTGGEALNERRLAVWELFVAASGLASLHLWGLPQAQVAHMRRLGTQFLVDATKRLASGAPLS